MISRCLFLFLSFWFLAADIYGADYLYSPDSGYVCGSRNGNAIRAKVYNISGSQVTFRIAAADLSRFYDCNASDSAYTFSSSGTVYLFRGLPSTANASLASANYSSGSSYRDLNYTLSISQKTSFYLAIPCADFEGYCYTDPIEIEPLAPTTGEVRVNILPSEAVLEGARWRLSGFSDWKQYNELLTGVPAGSYTLEFNSLTEWTKPASQSINVLTGRVLNSEGVYVSNKKFSVAGQITLDGNGVGGVTVNFSGYQASTNNNGNYSITDISPGTSDYVTPTKANYSFTPVRRYVASINADRSEMNFTANQDTAQISVEPISLSFPGTAVGSRSTGQAFQISNIGALPLSVSSISAPDGFELADFTSGTIASGQSATVKVIFAPGIVKSYSDKIIVNSNAANAGGKTVTVTGTGDANSAFQEGGYLLGNPNNHSPASSSTGFGVNVVTGNFFYEDLDASMPGKDLNFAFVRAYNSMSDGKDSFGDAIPEPLGRGWTHSYHILLRIKNSQAEIIWGDGSRDGFVLSGSTWVAVTPNNRYQLQVNSSGWIISSLQNNQYFFNSEGRLTRLQSRHGNKLEFTYSAGQLARITGTAGRQVNLSYANSRLSQLSLPIGRVQYDYTSDGLLKIVTDRRSNTWRYVYQSDLLRVIHRANSSDGEAGSKKILLKIAYDAEDRVKQQDTEHSATDGVGTYSFSWSDNAMDYNSPTGRGAKYEWDGENRLTKVKPVNVGSTLARQYTKSGIHAFLPDQINDSKGRPQTLGFNGFNLESFTDTAGRSNTLGYTGTNDLKKLVSPSGLTTTIDWVGQSPDSLSVAGNGISETIKTQLDHRDADGVLQSLQRGSQKTVVTEHHSDGQPRVIKHQNSSGTALVTETRDYDDMGRIISLRNSLTGSETCYGYDANGNPRHIVSGVSSCPENLEPVVSTASVGHTVMEYDANNRLTKRLVAYRSPEALAEILTYNDITGKVSKRCLRNANGEERCQTYRYNNDLQLYETTESQTGRKHRLHTLNSGHLQVSNQNAGQTDRRIVRRELDANGHLETLSSCSDIESGSNNQPHADCADHQERLRIERDSLDRPTKIYTQLGRASNERRVVTFSYSNDGRITTQTEPEGNKTIRETDALGRLIRVTQEHNGQVLTSLYEYDANNNLTKITDPSERETTFTYDSLGRRLSRTDLSGEDTWEYPDGFTTVHKEPDGTSITYKRDVAGNLIKLTASDGFTVDYVYNAVGQKTKATWAGGGSGQRIYQYTKFGELESVTDSTGKVVEYDYDPVGRLANKRYAGIDLTYSYNGLDQLKTLLVSGLDNAFTFHYDAFTGALLKQDFPNGVETTYERNLAGELVRLGSVKGTNTFLHYGLTLDRNGRRSTIQAEQPQALQQAEEELNFSFTSTGLLNQLNGNAVNYDGRSNILSIPAPFQHTYSYDALNRVKTHNGIQHEYDDSRRRIAKTEGGETERYLWDVNTAFGDVVAKYDGNTVQQRYVYAAGGLLAQIEADGTVHYVHQDFNHNVVALTDATGGITDSFAWSPYGRAAGRSGTTDTPFGFAGGVGVMADSADSIYMRARHYHTGLRQFTSPDLVEGNLSQPQSLNRYAYVEGMAFSGIDPSGFCLSTKYRNELKRNRSGYYQSRFSNILLDDINKNQGFYTSQVKNGHSIRQQCREVFNKAINISGSELNIFDVNNLIRDFEIENQIYEPSIHERKMISKLIPITRYASFVGEINRIAILDNPNYDNSVGVTNFNVPDKEGVRDSFYAVKGGLFSNGDVARFRKSISEGPAKYSQHPKCQKGMPTIASTMLYNSNCERHW